jgi:hypothetical protein
MVDVDLAPSTYDHHRPVIWKHPSPGQLIGYHGVRGRRCDPGDNRREHEQSQNDAARRSRFLLFIVVLPFNDEVPCREKAGAER